MLVTLFAFLGGFLYKDRFQENLYVYVSVWELMSSLRSATILVASSAGRVLHILSDEASNWLCNLVITSADNGEILSALIFPKDLFHQLA